MMIILSIRASIHSQIQKVTECISRKITLF